MCTPIKKIISFTRRSAPKITFENVSTIYKLGTEEDIRNQNRRILYRFKNEKHLLDEKLNIFLNSALTVYCYEVIELMMSLGKNRSTQYLLNFMEEFKLLNQISYIEEAIYISIVNYRKEMLVKLLEIMVNKLFLCNGCGIEYLNNVIKKSFTLIFESRQYSLTQVLFDFLGFNQNLAMDQYPVDIKITAVKSKMTEVIRQGFFGQYKAMEFKTVCLSKLIFTKNSDDILPDYYIQDYLLDRERLLAQQNSILVPNN